MRTGSVGRERDLLVRGRPRCRRSWRDRVAGVPREHRDVGGAGGQRGVRALVAQHCPGASASPASSWPWCPPANLRRQDRRLPSQPASAARADRRSRRHGTTPGAPSQPSRSQGTPRSSCWPIRRVRSRPRHRPHRAGSAPPTTCSWTIRESRTLVGALPQKSSIKRWLAKCTSPERTTTAAIRPPADAETCSMMLLVRPPALDVGILRARDRRTVLGRIRLLLDIGEEVGDERGQRAAGPTRRGAGRARAPPR